MKALAIFIFLLIVYSGSKAQTSWDYAWNYSTTMRYYSNKAAIQKALKQTDTKEKKSTYEMYPHKGKSTYDNKEEKFSDFKLWQIATESLKGIDWTKQGAKTNTEAYKMKEAATKDLISKYKSAIQFHNEWLTKRNYAVNDLAITWALSLALAKNVLDSTIVIEKQVSNLGAICRTHLTQNGYVNKTNYEKALDQLRLISWGVRPYLQYNQGKTEANIAIAKQAEQIARAFVSDYNPEVKDRK